MLQGQTIELALKEKPSATKLQQLIIYNLVGWSLMLGVFGVTEGVVMPAGDGQVQEIREVTATQLAHRMRRMKKVLVVPGYGMAVARCQSVIAEIARLCRSQGIAVIFGIHPVAGRLPGHMNVLLAEANVPYDIVHELEEINEQIESFDLAIVLGANDIVNPATQTDPQSPIYGMPAIEVWKAKNVIVSKRSMAQGYAGIENPLFYKDNSRMLYGDAKKTVDALVAAL
jgi:NAD/NADP transhydrogenase beta subunit